VRTPKLALLLGGLLAIALAVVGTACVSGQSTTATCQTVTVGSIKEAPEFTSYDEMLSHLPPLPINPTSAEATAVPAAAIPGGSLDGLARQWATGASNGALYQYFGRNPLSPTTTVSEFFAAGGLEFDRDAAQENFSQVQYLLQELGDRAVPVEVGSFHGAITWSDPDENGIRTHNLYWGDGESEYSIHAVRAPEELVNIVRRLVCSATS
jgi:hypothetical protein